MSTSTYNVETSHPQDGASVPNIDAEFGRVTVVLGANVAGKSSLMRRIVSSPGLFNRTKDKVIAVEGGRVIKIPGSLQVSRGNFEQVGTLASSSSHHQQVQRGQLASRVELAIHRLARQGDEVARQHSDEVEDWLPMKKGPCPTRRVRPLDRLFQEFSCIFPSLSLSVGNDTNRPLMCLRRDSERGYSADNMSDGEQQVLAILADVALLAERDSLVVVDEPELNLHPDLACRLWSTVEHSHPEATFVYATHCIGFALRPSVDKVIVLNRPGEQAMEIGDLRELGQPRLREFLGAIPGILYAAAAIAVEGDESSIDSVFYPWLLQGKDLVAKEPNRDDRVREDVAVVPLGGCEDVRAATSRSGIWESVAPSAKVVGVIDRDYRSEAELEKLRAEGCVSLDLHEVESYLCLPDVICKVGAGTGLPDPQPTVESVTDEIKNFFQTEYLTIAAKRAFRRMVVSHGVSLSRQALLTCHDEETLRARVGGAAQASLKEAAERFDATVADRVLREELSRCRRAFERADLTEMLRLAPGRKLLSKLVKLAGCADMMAFARAVTKHVTIEEVPELVELRNKLLSSLELQVPETDTLPVESD